MKNQLLVGAAVVVIGCGLALGQAQYQVLYNFGSVPNDGLFGNGTLVADRTGNLYGLTMDGGTLGGGTVFELSQNSDGTWGETTLYNLCNVFSVCPEGSQAVGLTIDSKGNLYGATRSGGNSTGGGVAFELSPSSGGTWTYTVLYSFCTVQVGEICEDGTGPSAPLTLDASGNLYGTAEIGGQNDQGVVFELSPQSTGWIETVLYSFCSTGGGYCLDGARPLTAVTFDRSGNIYGTTHTGGGANSYTGGGVLFRLLPGLSGWTEQVVKTFPPAPDHGNSMPGPVSIDPAGRLYTTLTSYNGEYSDGAVIRVGIEGGTSIFRFDGTDGLGPDTGVLVDARRRVVYGTTVGGPFGFGNVFEINKTGAETVLYNFESNISEGYLPGGGLLEDSSGHLYGLTLYGGTGNSSGVVFEITP